jgi:hypothetical protein
MAAECELADEIVVILTNKQFETIYEILEAREVLLRTGPPRTTPGHSAIDSALSAMRESESERESERRKGR